MGHFRRRERTLQDEETAATDKVKNLAYYSAAFAAKSTSIRCG